MQYTLKALLLSGVLSIFSIVFGTSLYAQEIFHTEFEGTWVLDSVQIKETTPDNILQKTVLPGDNSKFDNHWMLSFTLESKDKASYTETDNRTISDVPYSIKNKSGNAATLIIDGIPDYKILNIQLLSDSSLLISHSFSTGYNLQDIDVFWKMYYHKSNK